MTHQLTLLGFHVVAGKDEYDDPYDDSWMEDTIVSQPFSVQHQIHVDFDSDSGFRGLPDDWAALLGTGVITKEEVLAKPDAVLSCLETQAKFIKAENEKFLNEAPEPISAGEVPDEKSVSLSKRANTSFL